MKKKTRILLIVIVLLSGYLYFQHKNKADVMKQTKDTTMQETSIHVTPSLTLTSLDQGLSVLRHDEDYGFQGFLDAGGANSDEEVLNYLMQEVLSDVSGLQFLQGVFGCSTIQTSDENQNVLFGRNFDWEESEALIIQSNPSDAYASIATVNLNFIQSGTSMPLDALPDDILASVAMYAPLDGMNEKGVAISVNMIEDSDLIQQRTQTQNLTTTTAIRLILNQAASVEEAIELLRLYNMNSSMGMMIHFAIADALGNSVVVEYVNNEMNVIESPVLTNFYLTDGEKRGIGSAQSHERYDLLMYLLETNKSMNMDQVRDALDHVSKDNFDEFASTEWSIVYNLSEKRIHYFHRENYDKRYILQFDE